MSIQKINGIQEKYFYVIDNLTTDKIRLDKAMKDKETDLKISLSSDAYADLRIIKDFMHYLEMVMNVRIKDYEMILTYKKFFKEMSEELKKLNLIGEIEQLIAENTELREQMNQMKTDYIIKESHLLQAQARVQKEKIKIQSPFPVQPSPQQSIYIPVKPLPAKDLQQPLISSLSPIELGKKLETTKEEIALFTPEEEELDNKQETGKQEIGEFVTNNISLDTAARELNYGNYKSTFLKLNPGIHEKKIPGFYLLARKKAINQSRVH